MDLILSDEQEGDVRVIRLEGRIDTLTAKALDDHLLAQLSQKRHHLLLSLAKTNYVSSSGLRILLQNAKRVASVQGSFVLCDLQRHVLSIFEMSGFDRILTLRGTLAEGLSLMGGQPR